MAQNARKQSPRFGSKERPSAPELADDEVLESDVDAQEGNPRSLGEVLGSQTGEGEDIIAPGGWAGTDDATSTAPSDCIGLPPSDQLAELTGGAVSDRNPLIEGEQESPEDLGDAIRNAEDRIVNGGRHPGRNET